MDFEEIVKGISAKPYYTDKDGVIYLADCRDILPQITEVDILHADPPYGIDYQSCRRVVNQRKDKITGDKEFPLWLFDVVKSSVASFIWCRWDILSILPPPEIIYCVG
jgi:DNA modification methylase